MPSSDRTRFRVGESVEPGNDRFLADLVNTTLLRFPEICRLRQTTKDELIAGIVEAIQFKRVGLAPRRFESSGAGPTKLVFANDVEFVLRRAGLPASNTRDGLLHSVIRALADKFNIEMPQDLIRLVAKARRMFKRDGIRHYTTYRPGQ